MKGKKLKKGKKVKKKNDRIVTVDDVSRLKEILDGISAGDEDSPAENPVSENTAETAANEPDADVSVTAPALTEEIPDRTEAAEEAAEQQTETAGTENDADGTAEETVPEDKKVVSFGPDQTDSEVPYLDEAFTIEHEEINAETAAEAEADAAEEIETALDTIEEDHEDEDVLFAEEDEPEELIISESDQPISGSADSDVIREVEKYTIEADSDDDLELPKPTVTEEDPLSLTSALYMKVDAFKENAEPPATAEPESRSDGSGVRHAKWIHHIKEDPESVTGIYYLPQRDCSYCGYTSNNYKKICPQCRSVMDLE